MKNSQRLQIRSSEIRSRLNEIAGIDGELTTEIRSENETLATEYADVESKLRAALLSEGDEAEKRSTEKGVVVEDAEHRERRALRSKSTLANYIRAAINGRSVDGAEAEFSAAYGLSGHAVPLAMWSADDAGVEHRAITPGPATADTSLPGAIVPDLFAGSVAEFLGVDMPTVGVGDVGYPVLATSVTAGPKAKSAAAVEDRRGVRGHHGDAEAHHGRGQVPAGRRGAP